MKNTVVHLTEYPPQLGRRGERFFRIPNYKRLAKIRNLKRCPRRLRLVTRVAKRNTIITFSTAPAVDPWSESMIAAAVKSANPSFKREFLDD